MQCHPNLRVALETTNPRAVTGTWIEDDHGSGFGAFTVHRHGSAVTCDTQQRVIRRVLEPARIENSFVVEGEQRWQPRLLVGEHVIGALALRVEEQDAALEEIDLIPRHLLDRCGGGAEARRRMCDSLLRLRYHGR